MSDPTPIPDYTRVAWLFGRRYRAVRALSSDDVTSLARAVCDGAEARGLSPATLHGAHGAPFTAPDEVVLGAVLNGVPVVRERAEMRDGVLARHHAATQARLELGARIMHSRQEDLSVEEDWADGVASVLSEVEAGSLATSVGLERTVPDEGAIDPDLLFDGGAPDGCAWHLVARDGASGAVYFGTLLPTAGAPYDDGVIDTVMCHDEDDQPVARIVGRRLLTVDVERPLASLPAAFNQGPWRSDVSRRLEGETGKFRPTSLWLVFLKTG